MRLLVKPCVYLDVGPVCFWWNQGLHIGIRVDINGVHHWRNLWPKPHPVFIDRAEPVKILRTGA